MINKNRYRILNNKRLLHKVGKQWVTVSAMMLSLLGGSLAMVHIMTHADTIAPTTVTKSSLNNKSSLNSENVPQLANASPSSKNNSAFSSTFTGEQATNNPLKAVQSKAKILHGALVSQSVQDTDVANLNAQDNQDKVKVLTKTSAEISSQNKKINDTNPSNRDAEQGSEPVANLKATVPDNSKTSSALATYNIRSQRDVNLREPVYINRLKRNSKSVKWQADIKTIGDRSKPMIGTINYILSDGTLISKILLKHTVRDMGGHITIDVANNNVPANYHMIKYEARHSFNHIGFDEIIAPDIESDTVYYDLSNGNQIDSIKIRGDYNSSAKSQIDSSAPSNYHIVNGDTETFQPSGSFHVTVAPNNKSCIISFKDIYSPFDGITSIPSITKTGNLSNTYVVTAPQGYTLVNPDGSIVNDTNNVNDNNKSFSYGAGNQTINIAPVYKGMVYKYNKSNQSVEFISGIADSNLSNFLIYSPFKNAKFIKFDSDVNTNNTTNMYQMFGEDMSLKSLSLNNHFGTSNVTNMTSMFSGDISLQNLALPDSFDTRNVKYMVNMFGNDKSLEGISFGNHFDTSNVTNMNSMFSGDISLQNLALPDSFDTHNVKYMSNMFDNDKSLKSISLGNCFDTSNVTNMKGMFNSDNSLQSLDLSNFDTGNVRDMRRMFLHDNALIYLNLGGKFTTRNLRAGSEHPGDDSMFLGKQIRIGDLITIIQDGKISRHYYPVKSLSQVKFVQFHGTRTKKGLIKSSAGSYLDEPYYSYDSLSNLRTLVLSPNDKFDSQSYLSSDWYKRDNNDDYTQSSVPIKLLDDNQIHSGIWVKKPNLDIQSEMITYVNQDGNRVGDTILQGHIGSHQSVASDVKNHFTGYSVDSNKSSNNVVINGHPQTVYVKGNPVSLNLKYYDIKANRIVGLMDKPLQCQIGDTVILCSADSLEHTQDVLPKGFADIKFVLNPPKGYHLTYLFYPITVIQGLVDSAQTGHYRQLYGMALMHNPTKVRKPLQLFVSLKPRKPVSIKNRKFNIKNKLDKEAITVNKPILSPKRKSIHINYRLSHPHLFTRVTKHRYLAWQKHRLILITTGHHKPYLQPVRVSHYRHHVVIKLEHGGEYRQWRTIHFKLNSTYYVIVHNHKIQLCSKSNHKLVMRTICHFKLKHKYTVLILNNHHKVRISRKQYHKLMDWIY